MAEISPPTPTNFTATKAGLVPASVTSAGTKVLRDDATFGTAPVNYGLAIAVRMGAYI